MTSITELLILDTPINFILEIIWRVLFLTDQKYFLQFRAFHLKKGIKWVLFKHKDPQLSKKVIQKNGVVWVLEGDVGQTTLLGQLKGSFPIKSCQQLSWRPLRASCFRLRYLLNMTKDNDSVEVMQSNQQLCNYSWKLAGFLINADTHRDVSTTSGISIYVPSGLGRWIDAKRQSECGALTVNHC